MVPDDYSEFFVATATVAGALIGLLFVAISVRPTGASRSAHITLRLRAVAALSAFLNTLFLSLLALRPRIDLGGVALALGIAGLASMLILLVLLLAQGRDRQWPLVRGVMLVVGQGVLYAFQVHDGLALEANPGDASQVDSLAIIVIILFALGIARAWEFAGADNPSLLGALARVTGAARDTETSDESDDPARRS
ncbi:hypothetical protein LQ327_20405 [Actinomycetospora endophytica]|uniref:Uncharacterized protein n=1 Tax=Actinomycetospora endophytica TaxID=2291215 RepID=A0ABS8PBV0_9PSEU|nr:hypothetical protein [Actinomycetospora endophytica]MCD2195737.1 hypothetical protein [Actinomycetospora endophytica]